MKFTHSHSALALLALGALPLAALPLTQDDEPAPDTGASTISVTPFHLAAHRDPGIDGVSVFDQEGFVIKAVVEVPDRPFIQIVDDANVVRLFADDTGQDLSGGMDGGFLDGIHLGSRFDDDDMTKGVIEIRTRSLPDQGAGQVTLDATVVLLSARDLTDDRAAVAFAKGTKFDLAGLSFEITGVEAVEDDGWGDAVQEITVRTNAALDAIAEWTLLDEAGKEVAWDDRGTLTSEFSGKVSVSRSFGAHRALTSGAIRVRYYATLEEVEVPLQFELGLGL